MKCGYCNGTGEHVNDANRMTTREFCGGTGEIEATNEEWFCSLSTEEKANFFHDIVIRTMQATWDGKKPDYPAYLYDWKKWLKEKHNESV